MSVRKRPESRFYQYRFKIDGVSYAGSTKETNPGKARQFEAALMVKIRKGGKNPHVRKLPTLAEFAPDLIAHMKRCVESGSRKPNTLKALQNGWRMLKTTKLASMRLDCITTGHADELKFSGSGWNANRALTTLKRILNYACEQKLLQSAPRINKRKAKGRERTFTAWEEAAFLRYAAPVLRDILTIMLDCGMRPDEVCRMQWADIDYLESRVQVQEGKTDSARRYVGLTQRMRATLDACRKRNEKRKVGGSPYVFPSRAKSGHVTWLAACWKRTYNRVESAGKPLFPGLVPYSARHTYATNYLKAGGDIGQLSRLMGHTDIRTTMRYVHMLQAADSARIMDVHNEQRLQLVKKSA